MTKTILGIVGGSGLYDVDAISDAQWVSVDTPWGKPSDSILTGLVEGMPVAFLPRHARGHVHSPSTIPYRANIDALKQLGVTDVVSLSACGSFREDLPPGTFVVVDQFVDRTFAREKSFFGHGCVGHVSMASPTCCRLADACHKAATQLGIPASRGGTYLAMEGPQFSSLAESRMYRESWNCDVIGMTNMPEAKLAREAELCYSTVAMVTDFDCWHPKHGEIDITELLSVLFNNSKQAKRLVSLLPSLLGRRRENCPQGCDRVLDTAIITAPANRCPALVAKLRHVAGRALSKPTAN
ncbi:MAG: S-methyl-5'-thioadenosine phosphorylase [Rhodobacteraceae bacterium]|nr:S-methyl-5'-thioadenosine phosphorylase [Paracoccaceae bacterium]